MPLLRINLSFLFVSPIILSKIWGDLAPLAPLLSSYTLGIILIVVSLHMQWSEASSQWAFMGKTGIALDIGTHQMKKRFAQNTEYSSHDQLS